MPACKIPAKNETVCLRKKIYSNKCLFELWSSKLLSIFTFNFNFTLLHIKEANVWQPETNYWVAYEKYKKGTNRIFNSFLHQKSKKKHVEKPKAKDV